MYLTTPLFSILLILLSSSFLHLTLALTSPHPRDASTSVRRTERWIAAHRLEEWTNTGYHKKYRQNLISKRQRQVGGAKMIQVTESCIDIPSSLGTITQKCLTLVSDPSQSFCTTFLNGQNIGSDSGLGGVAAGTSLPLISNGTTQKDAEKVAVETATPSSSSVGLSSNKTSASFTSSSRTGTSTFALETSSRSVVSIVTTATAISSTSSTMSPESGTRTTTSTFPSVVSTPLSSISIDVVVNAPTASSDLSTTISLTSSSSSFISISSSPPVSFTLAATSIEAGLPDSSKISTPSTNLVPSPTQSASPGTSLSIDTASIVVINDPTSSGEAATAAAAQASTSTTPIPGQKLQVLPIGLGIFGGLVILTLLVVGYVLYERRKYKLQFRRRKDEEKASFATRGAQMGYTA